MSVTPAEARDRVRHSHNLHLRAYRPVPADRAVTLDYFMNDYVDHLEHHLGQVLEDHVAGPAGGARGPATI